MIDIITSVPDIFNTSIYPIAKQVVADIIYRLGIGGYIDNNLNYTSNGTWFSSSINQKGEVKLLQNRLDVSIKYTFAINEQKYEVTKTIDDHQQVLPYLLNSNHKVIFYDPLNLISVTEYERPFTITCTCMLLLNELVAAMDATQRLQSAFTTGVTSHEVEHSYYLPPSIYTRIYELYKMSNTNVSGFLDYLKEKSGDRIVKTVNRHDDTVSALSVRRNKYNIVSSIEFDQGEPAGRGKEKSPGLYEVPFTITTQMSMSNLIGVQYPIVIANQLIPKEYIPISENAMVNPPVVSHPYFSIDKYIKLLRKETSLPQEPVHIPWYDTWTPSARNLFNKYKPFFISILILDNIEEENAKTFIDLSGNLGGVTLVSSVIDLIREQGTKSLYFNDKLNISVYRNNNIIEPTTLQLNDCTLVVPNRGKYGVYRIVISSRDIIEASLNTIRIINSDINVKK